MYEKYFKRLLDMIFAIIGLIMFFPFFLLIAVLIKIDSIGPVFFRHPRLGKDGKVFKVWKFRTMCDNAENMGLGLLTAKGDPRITKVGKLLRLTSIDELPQLINVMRQEMSFIGPRPAPISHLEKYTSNEKKRLAVLPGISGWAQVNGRNILTWAERIDKDLWYVMNISLKTDFIIFFKTIKTILFFDGIYSGRNENL